MSDAFERYDDLEVFKKPKCLLETDDKGHLVIVKETAQQLRKINLPVNVVAIAGLYRTGKSYLMNRLAGEQGFALGNTIESKTKGIWAWCKKHPTQKGQVLLLLDTEGLGDVKKGSPDHDNKIFIIATLLSSTLVYNMMGTFNQDAVEKLTFISKMSENLKLSVNDTSDDDFDLVMPEFVLCIRDFVLKLEIDGKECTEDEYLEYCLKEKKTNNDERNENYNRPRRCIKKYFTKRKAYTFDRPGSRRIMNNLDNAKEEDLSEDFIQDAITFISDIYERPAKMLHNKQLVTGCMLLDLLEVFVKAIKNGNVPCIDDAITVMAKQENEKLAKDAIGNFRDKLKKLQVPAGNKTELLDKMVGFKTNILASLNSKLLFDKDKAVELSVERDIERISKEHAEENDKLIYEMCMKRIDQIYSEDVKWKIESGAYFVSGGYEKYKHDMEIVIQKYKNELKRENIDDTRAEHDFLTSRLVETEKIMAADKSISEQEKKDEMEKREKKLEEEKEKERQRYKEKLERQTKRYEDEMAIVRKAQEEKEKANTAAFFDDKLAKRDAHILQLSNDVARLQGRYEASADSDSKRPNCSVC